MKKTDEAVLSPADWKNLKAKLQYNRWQPMYNSELHKYLKSLMTEAYPDWDDLAERYLHSFDTWIRSSQLNQLKGLNAFTSRDFCLGVTHYLDDLHIRFGEHLVAFDKEYKYHWRIKPNMKKKTPGELSRGDVLVISMPFAHTGGIHPGMSTILDDCLNKSIPVHIDSAWFGSCRDIHFDYNHPAIESIGFSLSKGLGLGQHRAGIRYSKERVPGPVTVINDFRYYVQSVMWIGLKFMEKFSPDYLQNKYRTHYDEMCDKLGLKATPTIFVAYETNSEGLEIPVGVRPVLRWLSERRY